MPTKPPSHLSPAAKALYRSVVGDYALEAWHVRMLVEALQALDRADECRLAIGADLMVPTKAGDPKAHPLLLVERDCRMTFARLMRQLGLNADPKPPRR